MKRYFKYFVLVVSVVIFIYAAYSLLRIHVSYRAITNMNAELQNNYTQVSQNTSGEEYLVIDWEGLLNRNRDVVAWIYVPGTNINFPVLQGDTNYTYLRHNIDREFSVGGSIFMDALNCSSFGDLSTMIHGHNMRNDSMFSQVADLANGSMAEIPTRVHIYLPNGMLKSYKIVSINSIDISSALFNGGSRSLEDYFELMAEGSVVSVDFDRDTVGRILVLSTCGNFAANTTLRAVVYSVLEREIDVRSQGN